MNNASSRKGFTSLPLWERAIWALVLLGFLLANEAADQYPRVIITVFAFTLLVFCVRVFYGHGGRVATPLGIWVLMVGFTGGYAGLVGVGDDRVTAVSLATALYLLFLQTFGITLIAWGSDIKDRPQLPEWFTGVTILWLVSWITLGIAIVLTQVASRLGAVGEGIGFAAIVTMSLSAWAKPKAQLLSGQSAGIILAMFLYVFLLHSGSGRLRIVALGVCVFIVATIQFRNMNLKLVGLVLLPLMLVGLASYRLWVISRQTGAEEGRTGLESLTDPIVAFADLVQNQSMGTFIPRGFGNLLTPIAGLLPDSVDVPSALGYELVSVWRPESYGTDYSAAATVAGEWFWMGGSLGVIISIPLLGSLLRILDIIVAHAAARFIKSFAWTLGLGCFIVLAGGLGDLVWGGGHVYIYRAVIRVLVIVGLLSFTMLARAVALKELSLDIREIPTAQSRRRAVA